MTKPATHKTCHGVLLPLDAFAANKANPDGLQRYCRDCQKAHRADWTKRNAEKIAAYNAKRRGGEVPATAAVDAKASVASKALRKSGVKEDAQPIELEPAGLAELAHSAIVPSLTNPRKHFDHAFITELAESIKAQGVAQPILVRPLPGSRMAETYTDRRADAPRPTHEIVAGEQRWRACAMAGVRMVPALIRRLTDAEVLQLQLVENLKRRDLHPMEEAEGYERLRDTLGMSAEDIADRIGKGRSYVYKTLALLNLEPEAREAFYEGKLTRSTAELVAMRQPNLQLQVLKEITAPDFHGEPMSFRKAKAHVDERYMLRLGSAPFKITDETLVPDAGSCRTCPKRSGANPELFDDVAHADTCTDPTCFAGKKEAHYVRIRAAAEAKGQTVITGREAKEIMPDSNTLRGYTKVDDHQALGGQMKTLRKVLGKDMPTPTLIEDPKTHELVEVLPTAQVGKLLKEQGITKAPTVETSEAAAQRQGVETFEQIWRKQAVERIDEALAADLGEGFSAPVQRLVAHLLVDGLGTEERQHVCALLKLGKVAPREAIESHIDTCPEGECERVLMLLLVQHDMRTLIDGATGKATASARIEAVAKDFNIDVAGIKAGVKAAMKKAASDKKVESAAAAVRAQAAPAKPARKPKPSAAEATAEIAKQMQAAANPNAFTVGQRVLLKTDLRKGVDVFNTHGIEAEVLRPQGDRAWEVQPDTLSFSLIADYTEMEAIQP
jgi:ParB/RepB/Spo0J family partition protein